MTNIWFKMNLRESEIEVDVWATPRYLSTIGLAKIILKNALRFDEGNPVDVFLEYSILQYGTMAPFACPKNVPTLADGQTAKLDIPEDIERIVAAKVMKGWKKSPLNDQKHP